MDKLATTQLGNTGISVTRLSAGGHFTNGPTAHEDIPRRVREINHHIDSGITYFDIQWDPEELAMAEVMKTRSKEITVAWPLHGVTGLGGDVTAEYIIDYCNDHRKKYGIEHVDILLWIALELYEDTQDKVMDEVRKGFAKLKQDGFCEYLGFSCHHSPQMALHAINNFDDFEVMMVKYGFLEPAAERELLKLAKLKGIGTVAMKPFGGGGGLFNRVWAGEVDIPELKIWKNTGRPYQAGIKWALLNDHLDCVVPGMHSIHEIDEIVAAAKEPINSEDKAILDTYKKAQVELGDKGNWI